MRKQTWTTLLIIHVKLSVSVRHSNTCGFCQFMDFDSLLLVFLLSFYSIYCGWSSCCLASFTRSFWMFGSWQNAVKWKALWDDSRWSTRFEQLVRVNLQHLLKIPTQFLLAVLLDLQLLELLQLLGILWNTIVQLSPWCYRFPTLRVSS